MCIVHLICTYVGNTASPVTVVTGDHITKGRPLPLLYNTLNIKYRIEKKITNIDSDTDTNPYRHRE